MTEQDLTLKEIARWVGCTPHDVLEVLLQFDRASRVTITPGNDRDDTGFLAQSSG
ncbi:MAG: hypothetical protein Q8S73_16595 [Deltaproteobacteria bacterium]|nr:hypothetical protein [Deltaproteobacteria bacterium]